MTLERHQVTSLTPRWPRPHTDFLLRHLRLGLSVSHSVCSPTFLPHDVGFLGLLVGKWSTHPPPRMSFTDLTNTTGVPAVGHSSGAQEQSCYALAARASLALPCVAVPPCKRAGLEDA